MLSLICPKDGTELKRETQANYYCRVCKTTFFSEQGVVRFLNQKDNFYEGAYQNQVKFISKNETWHAVWPLWLIQNGYVWNVRKYVPEGSVVLEMGCASGVAYFGSRYPMIGADLSFAALVEAAKIYETCIQTDVTEMIPLPDQSIDAVISSYFWEHLDPTIKPKVLEECYRVLRPRGKLVFLYDVETQNPLIRTMKNETPERYAELFLKQDGHVGYETIGQNKAYFLSQGFSVLEHQGMEKTWIQSSGVYRKLSQSRKNRKWFSFLAEVSGRRPWFYLHTALSRILDETLGRCLPQSWARIVMTVCEKAVSQR